MVSKTSGLLLVALAVFASASIVSARTEPGRQLLNTQGEGYCWCYNSCGKTPPAEAGCGSNPAGPSGPGDTVWIQAFVKAVLEIGVDAYLAIYALISVNLSVVLNVLLLLKANVTLFVAILLKLITKDVVALVAVLKLDLSLVLLLLLNVDVAANLALLVKLVLQLLVVVDLNALAKLFVGIDVAIVGPILNGCGGAGDTLKILLQLCASISIGWYNALKPYCPAILSLYLDVLGLLKLSVNLG